MQFSTFSTVRDTTMSFSRLFSLLSHAEVCDSPPSDQNKHKPYKLCRNQSRTGIISGVNQWDFLGSGDVVSISHIHFYCINNEVFSFQIFCPTEQSSIPLTSLTFIRQGCCLSQQSLTWRNLSFPAQGSRNQWDFWFPPNKSTRWDAVLGYSVPLYPPNHTINFGIFHWTECTQNCQFLLLNRDATQIPWQENLVQ